MEKKKMEEMKNLSNCSINDLKLYNEGENIIENEVKKNKSSFPDIRLKTEQKEDSSKNFSKIKLTKNSYLRDLILKERLNIEKNLNARKRVKSDLNGNINHAFSYGNNDIKIVPNSKPSNTTLVDINKIDRIFGMPVKKNKKKK